MEKYRTPKGFDEKEVFPEPNSDISVLKRWIMVSQTGFAVATYISSEYITFRIFECGDVIFPVWNYEDRLKSVMMFDSEKCTLKR